MAPEVQMILAIGSVILVLAALIIWYHVSEREQEIKRLESEVAALRAKPPKSPTGVHRLRSGSEFESLADRILDTMWTTRTEYLPEGSFVLQPQDDDSKKTITLLKSRMGEGADEATIFREGCKLLLTLLKVRDYAPGYEELRITARLGDASTSDKISDPFKDAIKSKS